MCFPGGKKKALTFSYDDGVGQDRRLVELFNRYGLKGTFNLNSGIQSYSNTWNNQGVEIHRMNAAGLPALYQGHEIALHGLTHPHLETLDKETIRNEVVQDKRQLEALFGSPVTGMAYPFGSYNDTVLQVLREEGISYARTVVSTGGFALPEEPLTWAATCHHKDSRLMELAEEFVELEPEVPQLFYVWGHSYEFDVDDNWQVIEEFCRFMSGRPDIFYGTNRDVLLW